MAFFVIFFPTEQQVKRINEEFLVRGCHLDIKANHTFNCSTRKCITAKDENETWILAIQGLDSFAPWRHKNDLKTFTGDAFWGIATVVIRLLQHVFIQIVIRTFLFHTVPCTAYLRFLLAVSDGPKSGTAQRFTSTRAAVSGSWRLPVSASPLMCWRFFTANVTSSLVRSFSSLGSGWCRYPYLTM